MATRAAWEGGCYGDPLADRCHGRGGFGAMDEEQRKIILALEKRKKDLESLERVEITG